MNRHFWLDQGYNLDADQLERAEVLSPDETLKHGSVTLAAITSSTNGISHATSLLMTGMIKHLDSSLKYK